MKDGRPPRHLKEKASVAGLHVNIFGACELHVFFQFQIWRAEDMTASILYPSIASRLRRLPGTFWHLVRSIVRALRNFVRRREFFFVAAKIFSSAQKFGKKKFGPTRSILSKNRRTRSHPCDF